MTKNVTDKKPKPKENERKGKKDYVGDAVKRFNKERGARDDSDKR